MQSFGLLPADHVKPEHIEAWKAVLSKRYAPASVNQALRSIKTAFRWAVDTGLLDRSPFVGVKPARLRQRTYAPFIKLDDFQKYVLPTVKNARHRAAFGLAIYAGLRLSECASLLWEGVDFEREEIRIESGETFQTKSGRGRIVPLCGALSGLLHALPRACPYVLGITGPADPHVLSHAWTRTIRSVRESGINVPGISFHGLRHSFATHLAAAGAPLHALRAVMGHQNIQTTMIYAHVQPSEAASQIRAVLPSPLQIIKSA